MNAFEIPKQRFSMVSKKYVDKHKMVYVHSDGKVAAHPENMNAENIFPVGVSMNLCTGADQVCEIATGIVQARVSRMLSQPIKAGTPVDVHKGTGELLPLGGEKSDLGTGKAVGYTLTEGKPNGLITVMFDPTVRTIRIRQ